MEERVHSIGSPSLPSPPRAWHHYPQGRKGEENNSPSFFHFIRFPGSHKREKGRTQPYLLLLLLLLPLFNASRCNWAMSLQVPPRRTRIEKGTQKEMLHTRKPRQRFPLSMDAEWNRKEKNGKSFEVAISFPVLLT